MTESSNRPRHRAAIVLGVAAIGLTIAGCGGSGSSTSPTSSDATTVATSPSPEAPQAHDVTAYFMNADATALTVEEGTQPGRTPVEAALTALAAGPRSASAIPALPPGTTIQRVSIDGDEVLVDASSDFLEGYPTGGAAAELAVLAPLVFTATQAANAERVSITVDGKSVSPEGSQYDWSNGFTRDDFPDLSITGG